MHSGTFPNIRSEERCDTCSAGQVGFCGLLDAPSRTLLASRCVRAQYGAGDELAMQGECSDRVGLIAQGLVKVVVITEDGEEHVLQLLRPGEIVGEIAGSTNAFSWEAVTEVEICWIRRAALFDIMHERPEIHGAILSTVTRKLEELRLWAAAMRGRNTVQRIAFWLLQQVEDDRSEKPVIRVPLSRRDLASLLDMTSETLCRGLQQLSARHAIKMRAANLMELTDLAELRAYAGCPGARIGTARRGCDPAPATETPFRICERLSEAQKATRPISGLGRMERETNHPDPMTAINAMRRNS